MLTHESVLNSQATIDAAELQKFCTYAGAEVAAIRRGVLFFVQDANTDLRFAIRALDDLKLSARRVGRADIEQLCTRAENALVDALKTGTGPDPHLNRALDLLAEIEAVLLESEFCDDDSFPDISVFIDQTFKKLTEERSSVEIGAGSEEQDDFEIDEETLEIFRDEANDLLENISINIDKLSANADDRDALWNIRRSAHTFKGAAGIVGLRKASELAHRIEDLLDELAEDQHKIDRSVIDLLTAATSGLNALTAGPPESQNADITAIYNDFDRLISNISVKARKQTQTSNEIVVTSDHNDLVKPMPAPVVRVALPRLDELLMVSRELDKNESALAAAFGNISLVSSRDENCGEFLKNVGSLLEVQHCLVREMQDKLLRIRMVRFGILTTRLNRAVHVTCQEENKKASVVIENEDVEIDTQIVDLLVEPLLHLLRNAVVHGIESPETRRLIGKAEQGQICISVDNRGDAVIVSVRDDGRGVSAEKLKEKAISLGALSSEAALSTANDDALNLMFLRGVTTSGTLSMNAGRGVGMSIVKESIESGGGRISILSEPQRGTTFTITMPLASTNQSSDPSASPGTMSFDTTTRSKLQMNVLVVDDSPGMRQMITKIIEKAGCHAISASHGLDALEKLEQLDGLPDIILTDLEMPGLNGYELIEAIKKNKALQDVPVVMITSRTDPDYRRKAFELGADEFITKPFEGNSLIKTIVRLTSREVCSA